MHKGRKVIRKEQYVTLVSEAGAPVICALCENLCTLCGKNKFCRKADLCQPNYFYPDIVVNKLV